MVKLLEEYTCQYDQMYIIGMHFIKKKTYELPK